MKRLTVILALVVLALGVTSGRASASTHSSAMHQQKTVGPYRLVLQVGPAEKILMHRKGATGEVMRAGKQATCTVRGSSMDGMSMGSTACNRLVELHIYDRNTGHVIINAHVAIRMYDLGTRKSMQVPIMSMVGATTGLSDLHDGNNVFAAAGRYTVKVPINRVRTTFSFRLI